MVGEMSNKSLAILLVVTIVVSLGGTIISLSRINDLQLIGITGFGTTDTGNVSVEVSSTLSINFTTNATNFGTGTVHETCSFCSMNSSQTGSAQTQATCCVGFTGASNTGLVIENNGNENVTLDFQFDKGAADFIGGTNPSFKINITEGELGSCDSGTGQGSGMVTTWNNTWGDVPTAQTEVCSFFRPGATEDQLNVSISIQIPDNSKTGNLDSVVTATAGSI